MCLGRYGLSPVFLVVGAGTIWFSIEMALELGLTIRECDYEELLAGADDIPLRVVGVAKLKICRHGTFGAGIQWIPYWTDIEVYVLLALQGLVKRDMLLSWPTQNRLRLLNNNNENSDGLLRYLVYPERRPVNIMAWKVEMRTCWLRNF